MKETIAICAERGFNLTKFTSNSMELLESIPDGRRKNGVKNQDLAGRDKLEFKVQLKERQHQKRSMELYSNEVESS